MGARARIARPLRLRPRLTRRANERVAKGEMLSYNDVVELLGIPLAGVIPESATVLQASNQGAPVILDPSSIAAQAYLDLVRRFVGEEVPFRFLELAKRGFFNRMFGGGGEAAAYGG